MSSSRNFIVEGFDPTSGSGVPTNSQLLQMIHAAAPAADIGFVVVAESTPDVATYPEYEQFLWYKPSAKELYGYTGSAWDLIKANVIIPSKSITVGMLKAEDVAGKIIRVNATADGFEYVTPELSIGANDLSLSQVNPGTADTLLAVNLAGAWEYMTFPNLFARIITEGTGVTPINMLVPATGSGQFLYTGYVGAALKPLWGAPSAAFSDNSIPLKKLQTASVELTPVAGAVTIDASLADSFYMTLAANTTVTITNLHSGKAIQVKVKQAASGTYNVTAWQDSTPTAVKWPLDAVPTLTTTASHSALYSIANIGGSLLGACLNDYYV